MSEGDATESTINKSTPHSVKGPLHEDIARILKKQEQTAVKITVPSEQLSGNLRNNKEDFEKKVTVLSNGSSNYSEEKILFISEEARLGSTTRLLPRQAEDVFTKEMKKSSERSTLGSTTTRLSPRQVVGCSNLGDYNH